MEDSRTRTEAGARAIGEKMKSKKISVDIDDIQPHWCEDDFYRIFYNILNAAIPAFERYVIRAMRAVRDDPRLDAEPRLRDLIDIFNRQEAEHTRQHVRTNRKIGMDKIATSKFTEKIIRFIQRRTPVNVSVASSGFIEFVGFGFFKSHIDRQVLYTSGMQKEMAKLWKWHIAEEMEHSFIKLKVINHIDNSYWLKACGLLEGQIAAHLFVTALIPEIVWKDAKANGKPFLPHLLMFLNGLRATEWGVDRESVENYFSKDFDPEIKEPWVADVINQLVMETEAA
jgi:predicted metal-dependent hydrolase